MSGGQKDGYSLNDQRKVETEYEDLWNIKVLWSYRHSLEFDPVRLRDPLTRRSHVSYTVYPVEVKVEVYY